MAEAKADSRAGDGACGRGIGRRIVKIKMAFEAVMERLVSDEYGNDSRGREGTTYQLNCT